MGKLQLHEVAPGVTDVWRLWRHCLCRFGWYPLFVAPLVISACLLDLYSTTSCDFIRLNIGFIPTNDIWSDPYAQLGLFSFDSHELDRDKWKRTFNRGCQSYTSNFDSFFIKSDQTWNIARTTSYISGCASLIAVATVLLLIVTPLPASFFWPGVLLPAVVVAMIAGSAKFLFFDAQICSEELWFSDESADPVAPESCLLGESAVYGIAAVADYFLCTILICFRSPTKRTLDQNYGKHQLEITNVNTQSTDPEIVCRDIETGAFPKTETSTTNLGISKQETANEDDLFKSTMLQLPSFTQQETASSRDVAPKSATTLEESETDMAWSTDVNPMVVSFNDRLRTLSVPPPTPLTEDSQVEHDLDWNAFDRSEAEHNRSYSDGSTQESSSKSDWRNFTLERSRRVHNNRSYFQNSKEVDAGSVTSRISRISFADTNFSDDSFSRDKYSSSGRHSLASMSAKSAPSYVAIPRSHFGNSSPSPLRTMTPLQSSSPNGGRIRYARREDRNDIASEPTKHESKRDKIELLPPLKELTTPKNLGSKEDHGDLINKCVRDLKKSFGKENTTS